MFGTSPIGVNGTSVLVSHGVVDASGARHREVVLAPLTGHHELLLAETAAWSGAAVETTLLAHLVERVGGYEGVAVEHVRLLSRGDRHRLLLTILQSLVGDRLALVARCENPTCRALSDIDLRVTELLGNVDEARVVEVETSVGRVHVREPLGVDDEEAEGPDALWGRLVEGEGRGPLTAAEWRALPDGVRHAVALAATSASTAPDLGIIGHCPECRARFDLWLDPLQLLRQAAKASVARLYAEVHTLAWHYHWTEDQILGLPRERRWRYLELVRRHVEGRPLDGDWS